MRVALSWLREYAQLPEPVDATEVARRLTGAGLEVEALEPVGHDIRGVVVAQVLSIEELAGLKKPIRYCRVAVSEAQLDGPADEASGVICGAANFKVGDRVALALPGAVLPGGFEIGARRTYGHISEGMICSASELAIGDDHTGILVLPADAPLGADFVAYARLRDEVFEIAVTPDRGYAVSVRGLARELASAYSVPFTDPATTALPDPTLLGGPLDFEGPDGYPARIDDPTACDRFVLREVRGFSPSARTPLWIMVRLARCGVRPVSLAVDVTNYLMLELGQPMHAFDRSKLSGEIVVRRARPGERLETLDHVVRTLDPQDILITDSSGPISLAGTMGGLTTEIDGASTDLVIEAAHFSARDTAKMSPAAQAAQRGVLPVRTRRRPRAAAAGQREGSRDAGRAGRRPGGAGLQPRAGRRGAGGDLDGRGLPGSGGRRRIWPGHRRAPAARGRLHRGPDPGRRAHRGPVAGRIPVGSARGRLPAAGRPASFGVGPRRHPAVLASRPYRPGRPGRRGDPAGGV